MSNVTSSDRNRAHLYPKFAEKVHLVCADMNAWCNIHWPNHHATMSEGFRSQDRQQYLHDQGRTRPGEIVTWTLHSEHTTGMAADVVGSHGGPSADGSDQPTWDCPDAFWEYLTHVAHVHGLERISDYSSRQDPPHVQWPHGDTTEYQAARAWMVAQGLVS